MPVISLKNAPISKICWTYTGKNPDLYNSKSVECVFFQGPKLRLLDFLPISNWSGDPAAWLAPAELPVRMLSHVGSKVGTLNYLL